ncbi:related to cholinesterase [Phialocephala subalpina]|uniref:Related to cholinesterase n=1 Tax=Phialocephala subalpina TaxID=576137 RepID=A0A1L7XT30_9HELO|nr:related to cholinesterase [Phialocephala subalpina]
MKTVVLILTTLIRISNGALSFRDAAPLTVGGIVNTTSGPVQGIPSDSRPEVSTYLGIPYAQPPVGDLRFAAPVAVAASSAVINATAFSPDCLCNRIPTNEAYLAGPAGARVLVALAQTGDVLAEDCLTLNVWTKPQTGEAKKAVLFWIYGGGFSTGNTACPLYDGAVLADENDVVVISVNYRLNIFGFSGAPGQTTNVGLLDQRLALEWARDNVEAFGGDPSRITAFGQSAGGASVDYISYGFVDDPIVHALIPQSGVANSVISGGATSASVLSNWYNASETLGCGGEEAGEATVACMRTKSWQDILVAIEPLSTTAIDSGFEPVPDDIIIPNNLTARGAAGEFAKLPYLTGNTDNEAGFFLVVLIAYTSLTAEQFDLIPAEILQPVVDLLTLAGFTCSAAQAANYRAQNGVPVWRYRYYGGNYTNTYINKVGSAYHTSELPVLFGTAASVAGIADSDIEAEAARYMRQAWATFAKNPTEGLTTELGWPRFNPLSKCHSTWEYFWPWSNASLRCSKFTGTTVSRPGNDCKLYSQSPDRCSMLRGPIFRIPPY